LIAVVTCGICLGFLPHNFHPAKIFMGDGGALLLGLLMAASTMLIGGRSAGTVGGVAARSGQTYFFFAPLFIPFFILGVPIVDMVFAFVRRTANRTGFSTPDKNHLHHRLLRLGHGHRRSVLILWAWTALLSGLVLFPLYVSSVNAFIPFGVLALGVILYTLFHRQSSGGGVGRPRQGRPSQPGSLPGGRPDRGGRRPRIAQPRARFPSREQHVSGVLPRTEEKCDDAPRELPAYHPFGGVRPDGPRPSPAPHRHRQPDDL
jgi:hypothetical protein